jgi:SAM-dependent methyltransferase
VGIAGLALLRLKFAADASSADQVIQELRAVLTSVDDPEVQRERDYPVLNAAEGYSRWAAVYDLPGNALIAQEEPHVQALISLAGEPVLDAACGTGPHLAWLAAHGTSVIGVDQSPEMLARARVKVPDADLRQGQLESLPVDDQAVAGVVCALALEHVADLGPVFREFLRVLCPGGWLVVSVMHPVMAQIPGWSAWFIDEAGRADVATYRHQVSDYINAGLEHGFGVRHCREVPLDLSYFQSLGPAQIEFGSRIAFDGLPLVLILRFQTAEDGDQG